MFAHLPKIEEMKVAEERLFLGGKMRIVEAGNQPAKRDGARFRLSTRNSKGIFWVQGAVERAEMDFIYPL